MRLPTQAGEPANARKHPKSSKSTAAPPRLIIGRNTQSKSKHFSKLAITHSYVAMVKRLRDEFAKLNVEMNEEKSRIVDLRQGGSFGFLGFDCRRTLATRGMAGAICAEAQEADGIASPA
jgi:hypothetical protein